MITRLELLKFKADEFYSSCLKALMEKADEKAVDGDLWRSFMQDSPDPVEVIHAEACKKLRESVEESQAETSCRKLQHTANLVVLLEIWARTIEPALSRYPEILKDKKLRQAQAVNIFRMCHNVLERGSARYGACKDSAFGQFDYTADETGLSRDRVILTGIWRKLWLICPQNRVANIGAANLDMPHDMEDVADCVNLILFLWLSKKDQSEVLPTPKPRKQTKRGQGRD
ncbi:MAG: hypothetical protein DRP56_05140 [Planctomycetota bacterium]|nr:MAG: hypothetical protein DRP56_05140 [Planctomycetota bacterium]